jgi:hypothetical protein
VIEILLLFCEGEDKGSTNFPFRYILDDLEIHCLEVLDIAIPCLYSPCRAEMSGHRVAGHPTLSNFAVAAAHGYDGRELMIFYLGPSKVCCGTATAHMWHLTL